MKNQSTLISATAALIIISFATITEAQWTPDPFCPYPYPDHVTRYPYFGNCSVYWECYEGTKYVMECPTGLEFNAPVEDCDRPAIARCDPFAPTTGNPNPPTFTTGPPGPVGPTCPYPSDALIYFPYEGDCTRYWECYEGNSYLYGCPPTLWWHEEISRCDYPGDYCYNSSGPTTSGPQPDCPLTEGIIFYPYPGDCTKYWECYEGHITVQNCPEGFWWHEAISRCDYPGDFCYDNSNPTTSGPHPDCPLSDEIIFYPYPGDCTKYWECYEGVINPQDCPEGLWWHEAISECDYPGDFCYDSNPTTSRPPPECRLSGEIVYYPYPEDCTKYWECYEGNIYLETCPDGLWFHDAIARCDNPGSYCSGSNPTTSRPLPECVAGTEGVYYYSYDGDCTKYWICSNGDLYPEDCPDQLWWNQEITQCDYPGTYCNAYKVVEKLMKLT